MIHVALASNRAYFYGLLATVISLLKSNKANTFTIHIIDGGLSARQKRMLSRRVGERNRANIIQFHGLNGVAFRGFKPDYGNSYMTYARILVASLVDAERVIYLDTDLLVAADIMPLWESRLGPCVVAAAPDRDIQFVRDDYPFDPTCGNARYFNAGVMLINLTLWRERDIEQKLLKMITAHPERFRWWDQTAMNAIFPGEVHFIDPSWNTFADSMTFSVRDSGRIFHYVGGTKPWRRYLNTPEFRLWRAFFGRHARPKLCLFFERQLALSFLQFLRHRMLCHSTFLKLVITSILRLKAFALQKNHREAVAIFMDRHTRIHTLSNESASKMEDYILARWG